MLPVHVFVLAAMICRLPLPGKTVAAKVFFQETAHCNGLG